MIRLAVSSQDMVSSRFTISPLIETMHALWTISGRHEAGIHRQWVERRQETYKVLERAHPGLRAIAAISGNRGNSNVDFIAPPPSGVKVSFDDELAVVRATPVEQAHAEVARVLAMLPRADPEIRELLLGPDVVRIIADAFAIAWTEIVAPAWPFFHAVLERDVVQRAGRLATYGWAAALDDLSAQCRWRQGHIELRMGDSERICRLDGKGLLFLPTLFSNRMGAYLEESPRFALIYPARGIAAPLPAANDGLAVLIGRTRARILLELAAPGTTTQLAALLGIALGTTGEHLTALRRAGLVTATRTGRSVLYQRTSLGDALTAGAFPA
ncbi:winged helix-turn-helix domain-containing protein [Streptosporangium sp. KLBMP 9127]|nr:winged helix-turn-helix domain-containing protein [Streptosporangium sp. KLBMP 9127]